MPQKNSKQSKLHFSISKKNLLGSLAIIVALGGSFAGYTVYQTNSIPFDDQLHTVKRVIDGDTFVIEDENGDDIRVRMIGINAPELSDCGGETAKQALEQKIGNRQIKLRKNIEGIDDNGRLLRYVLIPADNPKLDDILVSQWLLSHGFAYLQNESYSDMYRDLHRNAENRAESQNLGIWKSCPRPILPQSQLREQDNAPRKKGCNIKGNISEKSYGKIYFTPGCPNYDRIKVDSRKGEQYFCTETEAQSAGFTRSESCNNINTPL